MSTPADMQKQFDNDNKALMAAAEAYNQSQTDLDTAEDNYKTIVLKKKLDACQTADQIMMLLEVMVFQSALPPSDTHTKGKLDADDSLLGIYGDQVGLQGKALQVNSYLTAVHNDLQKMVNSGSDDPDMVHHVATDLDTILDELNGKVGGSALPGNLPGAMDKTALQNMLQTDTALRNEFYIEGDTSGYNPPPNPDSDPSKDYTYTYHFTWGETAPGYDKTLHTFADMEKYMKEQGDQHEATEAYKNLTDNFNSDTGMSQTVNSEINEKINQLTNFIKTLMGFYENGILQPQMKMANAAIQNQTKGS